MGRGGASAREISFVSLMAYGPKVAESALAMGVTASETRQGGSQQTNTQTSESQCVGICEPLGLTGLG